MIFTSKKIIERSDLLEKYANNILAIKDISNSNKQEEFIFDYPEYDPDSANSKKHFSSVIKFKQWISDSIYYDNFIEDSLLMLSHKKWNLVIKKQYELLTNLKLLDSEESISIFLDSTSNLNYIFIESQLKLLDTLYSTKGKSSDSIKEIIKDQLIDILNIRKEAFQEINNSLINFSYSKPLLDNYLIADFLSNVSYDEYLKVHLVEKIRLPFGNNKTEVNRSHEDNNIIIIFPGYLILNSFLALFIGVFLQMIFDKKNIAEPI